MNAQTWDELDTACEGPDILLSAAATTIIIEDGAIANFKHNTWIQDLNLLPNGGMTIVLLD
uniref:Uncharacterized protein n=1 Tax=Oryza nivara TaxID=4536 RepID=A0A0E0G7Q4_ORYNI